MSIYKDLRIKPVLTKSNILAGSTHEKLPFRMKNILILSPSEIYKIDLNLIFSMKKYFLLTLVLLIFSSSAMEAQQQNQSAGRQNNSDMMNLYTDEIGLNSILNNISLETYIDPETYILGPFDALTVTIRGPVPIIMRGIVVNPLGEMVLPSVGNVSVRGLNIVEAQEMVKKEVSKYYRTDEVTLTLDFPRPVYVHIFGEAPRPGIKRIPAMTRVDMLVMGNILTTPRRRISGSEGDSEEDLYTISSSLETTNRINLAGEIGGTRLQNYSLRNVHIEHENGTTSSADLVGYYYSGSFEFNPVLQSGDRVYLSRRSQNSPRISISGMVDRIFETEYRSDDTIEKLLIMAGGFDVNADMSGVIVQTLTSSGIDSVFVGAAHFATHVLQPNSRVIVRKGDMTQYSQSVWVSGEVSSPGIYPIIGEVTSLYELIQRAGGLTEVAMVNAAFIERAPTWDSELPEDIYWHSRDITRTSNSYSEIIGLAYVERGTSSRSIPIDLRDVELLKRIKLRDNDKLIIPKDRRQVAVIGQVVNTGYFTFDPNISLSEYIQLAGGYALSANPDRIFIIKAGNKVWYREHETSLESGDMIYVERHPIETFEGARQYEIERLQYEIQLRQQRSNNVQIIISGISAVAGILTTYILLNNR